MSTILVIGTGPMMSDDVKKLSGHCLRTWHFVKPLLDDGHNIDLYTLNIFMAKDEGPKDFITTLKRDGFQYRLLDERWGSLWEYLQNIYEKRKFDCILGINTDPSAWACKINTAIPVWADLNGWVMAEAQIKAYNDDDDLFLHHYWVQERPVIRRADVFSAVSMPQLYALYGELATVGRLNKYTYDYKFAYHIPNAIDPEVVNKAEVIRSSNERFLRGKIVENNAFVVLWSGGYNTWVDVDTLFKGLEGAISENSNIHFVSTGGEISTHSEKHYYKFQSLIEQSKYKNNFHLLGWIEGKNIPLCYTEADVGINVDSFNNETIFGARNRITNMMVYSLPIITTLGTEISYDLKNNNAGITFEIGDWNKLKEKIVYYSNNREELRQIGVCGKDFALKNYAYGYTIRACREWAKKPYLSPDNQVKLEKESAINMSLNDKIKRIYLNKLEKNACLTDDIDDIEQLLISHRDLQIIRNKLPYKILKKIKSLFSARKEEEKRNE